MSTGNTTFEITLEGEKIRLLPEKAVFWEAKRKLLIADTHFGKSATFRKGGIRVTEAINTKSIDRLDQLLKKYQPEECIVLGDLFHSKANEEWESVRNLISSHRNITFSLIPGNHDILPAEQYRTAGIELLAPAFSIPPFLLVHDPATASVARYREYILSGHIHPGVLLRGKGRQSLRLPCFQFGEKQGILPAFGDFTGKHIVEPTSKDRIFGIVETGTDCRIVALQDPLS